MDEKIRHNFLIVFTLAACIFLFASGNAGACAACGYYSLSTDWQNLEYAYVSGLKLDIRYDYQNQDQLRSGTGTISPASASRIINFNGNQEIEKFTRSNYITLGIDYSTNFNWGINLQVPYIDRSHETLGTASDGIIPGPGGGQYNFHSTNFGDMKIMGRYQGFASNDNLGVLLGFKLATGSHSETGSSTDPVVPGPVFIDRGLQPGSGTTDVIFGVYYSNAINLNWGYFLQAAYQVPLYSTDHYKPGNNLNASFILRYMGFDIIAPQLQLSFHEIQHDKGENADTVSTGGALLYINPGVVVALSKQISVYSFVQVPVYQDVNGVQLTPRYTVTAGVRYSF
jgi:hypothetical protein